jgi:hypothetical protein
MSDNTLHYVGMNLSAVIQFALKNNATAVNVFVNDRTCQFPDRAYTALLDVRVAPANRWRY